MKAKAILSVVLAACLLTGCAVQPAGVEDLLRAPQLTGEENGVQKALTSYLGEAPQLKYPNLSIAGEAISPFLIQDFNGDGVKDAAAFYVSSAKGQNVHVAILEQSRDGDWYVTQEREGLATAVESISTAELQPGGGSQLLVGYMSSSGEKYLAVYAYAESTLQEVLTLPYSQFQLHPLASREASDLVIIGPEQTRPLQLQLLTEKDGQFNLAQQLDLDEQFLSCDGLYPSMGKDGSRYLVMDGHTATGLASCILHYDTQQQHLGYFYPSQVEDFFGMTQRFSPLLRSADINGNGKVEIPCHVDLKDVGTLAVNRLALVSWMDFTKDDPEEREVSFGVADLEFGYYLELPRTMKGNILITDGEDSDSWQVRSLDGEALYLTVRVVEPNVRDNQYFRLGNIGAHKVQGKITTPMGMSVTDLTAGFAVL